MQENNSFYPYQFGSGLIIQQIVQLLKLLFEKHVSMKGLFACGVYLDLKKAIFYDTVNHNISTNKNETLWYIKGNAN